MASNTQMRLGHCTVLFGHYGTNKSVNFLETSGHFSTGKKLSSIRPVW